MSVRNVPGVIDLSAGWEFAQGCVGSRWLDEEQGPVTARVDLPHCWNTRDTLPEDRTYYRGFGNYRRQFELAPVDPEWLWFLESGGFYGLAEVRLNGLECGRVDGQYLGFRMDVTEALSSARNSHRLGIGLTNQCPLSVLPGIHMPDFILYGGLASALRLVPRPRVRLHEDRVLARTRCEDSGNGTIEVGVEVINRSAREWRGGLRWEVRAADGSVVAQTHAIGLTVQPGEGAPVTRQLTVADPAIWGLRAPNFYDVSALLVDGETILDRNVRRVGFRWAEFRPDRGFFLNDERVELRGCNRHENGWGLGNALPDELHRRDAELLREMGLNFVRLSHYPQSPAFLDACDELGILVYAEIATWKSVRSGKRWLASARRQLEGMVLRDRHHPSVILWGLGNESRSRKAFLALGERVHTLDPGRPTIYAENHFYRAEREHTTGITDVWGTNYELNVREKMIAAARLKTAVVSECANYPLSRRGDFFAERHQVEMIKQSLIKLAHRPAIAGFALWCFADYATARKARYVRHCGMVDGNRLPKMSAHWLAATYSDRPVLELAGSWRSGVAEQLCEIHLFTNAIKTEVSVTGQPAQLFEGGAHHVFSRKFSPHDLVARATFADGTVRETRLSPWGAAARLSIQPVGGEPAEKFPRFLVVDVKVEDAAGNRVRDWNQPISIWVIGAATAALNNRTSRLEMGGGWGRFVLVSDGTARSVVVRAEEHQTMLTATMVLGGGGIPEPGAEFYWPTMRGRSLHPPEQKFGTWDGCDYKLIFLPSLVPRIRRTWLNEHRMLTQLGGAGGAPAPRGLNVGRDTGGYLVVLLRESIEGTSRLATEVTPDEAARWGAQVAAIHQKGVLICRARTTDWVWETGKNRYPRWRETGSGRIYSYAGFVFRWRAGREVGWLAAEWFGDRPAQSVAFWEGYRRGANVSGWMMRMVDWGRRFQNLRQAVRGGESSGVMPPEDDAEDT
jgi:hypothetical protein